MFFAYAGVATRNKKENTTGLVLDAIYLGCVRVCVRACVCVLNRGRDISTRPEQHGRARRAGAAQAHGGRLHPLRPVSRGFHDGATGRRPLRCQDVMVANKI